MVTRSASDLLCLLPPLPRQARLVHPERHDALVFDFGHIRRAAVGAAEANVARLLAITDVYDALRSRRVYKPGLSHHTTVLTMTEGSPGHFDPALMEVFLRVALQFDRIFRDHGD